MQHMTTRWSIGATTGFEPAAGEKLLIVETAGVAVSKSDKRKKIQVEAAKQI